MAQSTGSSGAGSGSRSSREWCAAASAEIVVAVCAQATPTSRPHLVFVAELRDCGSCPFCRRLTPPCLVQCQAVEGAIEDSAGKSGARLRLDAALEAAEDGHVAGSAGTTCFVAGGSSARRVGERPARLPAWHRWRGCSPCPREGSTTAPPCLGSARRREWLPSRSLT